VSGAPEPATCPAGYYCPGPDQCEPVPCPCGHFCPPGVSAALACTAGNWCDPAPIPRSAHVYTHVFRRHFLRRVLFPIHARCPPDPGSRARSRLTTVIQPVSDRYLTSI
jgi:hypothetical protein